MQNCGGKRAAALTLNLQALSLGQYTVGYISFQRTVLVGGAARIW